MKTYRHTKFGGPEGLSRVEEDIPAPGAHEVLIKVGATSLNYRDIIIMLGGVPTARIDGIPLSDGAGEVVSLGDGVTRFGIGDRVVNSYFPTWFGGALNSIGTQYMIQEDGWLTQYKVVDAEALVAAPSHLNDAESSTLTCAGVTAWSAINGVGPGDTILVQGSGGVAIFALQLAKLRGARVAAITSSDEKAERLRALGADQVWNYRQEPEWGDLARAWADGRGIDRIVETGGPSTMPQSIKAVAIGGQVSIVGMSAGAVGGIDFLAMFGSQARYQPICIGSRRDLEDLVRTVAAHGLRPVIDRTFALDDAPAGFAHLAARNVFGKIVIDHQA
jgi:NADPH:quinone reductase-like Zn-dependent oxidoreductase